MGHVVNNPEQYAGFFAAGYDACKSVFPDAIVMVHLDNGFDKDLYDFNLGVLRDNGAKWATEERNLHKIQNQEYSLLVVHVLDRYQPYKKSLEKYRTIYLLEG